MTAPRPRLYVVRDEPLPLPESRERPWLQILGIVIATVVLFLGAVWLGCAVRHGG